MPLFPEREKVRGPAFGREPCIDDRLPLPCALAKEKMPAEWLLNFKLGLLICKKSSHMMNSNLALSSLTAQIPQEAPGNYKMSKVNDKAELTKSYIGDGSVVEKKGSEKSEGEVSKSIWAIIV